MQNKYIKFLLIALIIAFIIPQITLAAWYNPFSWHFWGNFWNYFFHKQTPAIQQFPLTSGTLRNATITYPNPYDTSKNDTITLVGGHALIHDAGNIMPRAYDVAATAVGDLNGDGTPEGVIGIYQGYGANIIVPIVFVFSDKNGRLTQIDSVLPDTSIWNSETQIKSISINNGVLSVNLLVLAEKDQSLPHYQQQASIAKTVQYKLVNGKLAEQQADVTAGWKTYTDANMGISFSFEYPSSWTYQKVSCNLDYVAFCPLAGNSPSNCGMTCAMNGPNASIYLYTFQGSPAIGVASQNIKYWAEPNASLNLWDNKYKEIYTEMISTFKFMTPTDQTAGWKTYTNSQYGFEVKYPAGGTLQNGNGIAENAGTWVDINLWTDNSGVLHPDRKTMYIQVDEAVSMHPCGDPFKNPDGTITRKLTDVYLNGVEFTKGDVSPYRDLDLESADEYCTVRNGNRYQIIVGQYLFGGTGPGSPSSALESDTLINQAVSTFKFTK